MLMTEKTRVESKVGMGWNSTVTFLLGDLLGDRTLEQIVLRHNAAVTRALMTRISVEIGGQEIILTDATFLHELEQEKGNYTEDGFTVIPFGDVVAETLQGRMQGGLPVFAGENAYLKIKLGGGAGTPEIDLDVYTSPLRERRFVPVITEESAPVAINGRSTWLGLPKGKGLRIKRIFIKATDIAEVKIKQAGRIVYESDKAGTDYDLQAEDRVPRAGYYVIDLVRNGFVLDEVLDTESTTTKLELEMLTNDAARTDNTVPVIIERVEEQPL